MTAPVLEALLDLRGVHVRLRLRERDLATAEFKKAAGILGGLWERVRDGPSAFLDRRTLRGTGSTPPPGTSWPG